MGFKLSQLHGELCVHCWQARLMACRLAFHPNSSNGGFRKINTNIAIKFKVKNICFSQKLLANCTLFWGVAGRCGFI